jgi:hypothetical protein
MLKTMAGALVLLASVATSTADARAQYAEHTTLTLDGAKRAIYRVRLMVPGIRP